VKPRRIDLRVRCESCGYEAVRSVDFERIVGMFTDRDMPPLECPVCSTPLALIAPSFKVRFQLRQRNLPGF
jgi:hypothetical protein